MSFAPSPKQHHFYERDSNHQFDGWFMTLLYQHYMTFLCMMHVYCTYIYIYINLHYETPKPMSSLRISRLWKSRQKSANESPNCMGDNRILSQFKVKFRTWILTFLHQPWGASSMRLLRCRQDSPGSSKHCDLATLKEFPARF